MTPPAEMSLDRLSRLIDFCKICRPQKELKSFCFTLKISEEILTILFSLFLSFTDKMWNQQKTEKNFKKKTFIKQLINAD